MSKFKDGLVQNMLFAGSPGTGKTSCAKAIVNQFNLPYLYINASTDTSVDVIRTRIIDFCSTVSIMDAPGSFKVVILDCAEFNAELLTFGFVETVVVGFAFPPRATPALFIPSLTKSPIIPNLLCFVLLKF